MNTTTELVTFEIRVEHMYRFTAEFAALAKKAKKLKVAAPSYEVLGEKVIPAVLNAKGEVERPARVVNVIKVSGQAPKIAGWTFVAVLQHEELGNIVRRVPGSESIKVERDLREVSPFCNHCNTDRRRKDTYVVAHEDGRQLQIGRNCLKDFTGHDSPEAIARWAELLHTFEESVDEENDRDGGGFGGGGKEIAWSLLVFLATVAAAVREHGWLSRGKARELEERYQKSYLATADITCGYLCANTKEKAAHYLSDAPGPADHARAEAAITYAKAHFEAAEDASRELDDYEYNLRLIVEGNSVVGRSTGLAASLLPFVERLQGKEIERRKAAKSEFQGTVGKRETFTLIVTRVVSLHSEMYGTSYLHLMQDEAGNRFTWKTSSYQLQAADIYRVFGTVKAHDVYSREPESSDTGIKQTKLTRCVADQLCRDDVKCADGETMWTVAAAKRAALEAELAAKAKAAKEEAKAAKKAERAAKKAADKDMAAIRAAGVV